MKKLLTLFLLINYTLFAEIETKSFIGLEYKSYIKKQDNKDSYNLATTFQSEIKYEFDDSKIYTKFEALKDNKDEKRDYFLLDELYYSKSFDNFDLDLGKKVVFLGTLEAQNIVDIFNRQNYQKDSLAKHKKGSLMANINYFFEDDSIFRFYIKAYEEDIKFPSKTSVYNPFGVYKYKKNLEFSNNHESPSFLATYTTSYDEEIVADISFGLFHGYDENIIFKKEKEEISPLLFQSTKFLSFNTFVIDSTLYKLEASYTDVKKNKNINLDNFYKLGLGLEYTIEQVYKNHNLGFISEYYKSNNKDLNFQNDIFLALRYSLNDSDSSEFLAAYVKDLKEKENSAYIKYNGRLTDNLNISTDLRYIKSNSYLDEHLRFGCEFKYYF